MAQNDLQYLQDLHNRAWQLLRVGRQQEAIDLYTKCFEKSSKFIYLYNRGLAYLEAGNYESALADFRLVAANENPDFIADAYFIYQGVCHWYLNQPSEVLPIWEKGLAAPYTDAAGGVELPALLLYGAERLHDLDYRKLALRLLRKHARRKLQGWPGPIVPFLLGKTDVEVLQQNAQATPSDILRSRWQCQADFYIALHALREGDRDLFRVYMKRCAENPYGYHETEYYLAHWELAHNFPDPAFG